MLWLEASWCFLLIWQWQYYTSSHHHSPQWWNCKSCATLYKPWQFSSSHLLGTNKSLPKKATPKQCFGKQKAHNKVSINNFTHNIFSCQVRGLCTFSLRSQQRKLIYSFWNAEMWLVGLLHLIFFFLHHLFFLSQSFHCDPNHHLVFSLFNYINKHYLHSFKCCKANVDFYHSPYTSWQARWEPLTCFLCHQTSQTLNLLKLDYNVENSPVNVWPSCVAHWVPMTLLCSVFSSLSGCGCPSSTFLLWFSTSIPAGNRPLSLSLLNECTTFIMFL